LVGRNIFGHIYLAARPADLEAVGLGRGAQAKVYSKVAPRCVVAAAWPRKWLDGERCLEKEETSRQVSVVGSQLPAPIAKRRCEKINILSQGREGAKKSELEPL